MVRVPHSLTFSGFSWEYAYARYPRPRGGKVLWGSTQEVDLPASLNIYTFQPAIPSAGSAVTAPSPRHWNKEVTEC